MADGRFDEHLLGMAQKHKGIEDLLYTIMSFYERRTDLFHVREGDSATGFQAGEAEEMMRKQFRLLQGRYLQRAQPHLIATPEQVRAARAAEAQRQQRTGAGAADASAAAPAPQADAGFAPPPRAAAPAATAAPAAAPRPIPDGVGASPLDGGDPGQWERLQAKEQGFTWHQSVTDVTVEIDVEKSSASDIKVAILPKKLTVKRKGEVLIEGALHEKINVEESTWYLDSGRKVVVTLEKIKENFWTSLLDQKA